VDSFGESAFGPARAVEVGQRSRRRPAEQGCQGLVQPAPVGGSFGQPQSTLAPDDAGELFH
jgi:hypothetical protein